MDSAELIGQATDIQVEEWKKRHGKVFEVKVENHICYLRKPDRRIMSAASSIGMKDPIKFNEVLLTNCWLGGSEAIKTDDDLFMAVSQVLSVLIEIKSAEIKNL